jgi:hypothetical protein
MGCNFSPPSFGLRRCGCRSGALARPLGKSGPCGAKVRLEKGDVTVTHGPFSDSVLMGASGFALFRASKLGDASQSGVGTTRIFCHAFRRESANVCHSLSHAENGCCAPN